MNTILSKMMQKQLNSVSFGTAVHRTYCNDSATWSEELFQADISPDDKLLIQQYMIFPGIEMSYNYFLTNNFSHQHPHMPTIMEISHCRYGRMGWQMEHNLNLYLGEGDLSLHMKDYCSKSHLSFPLGYYEGISFSVDFQELQKNPPDILKESNIDYKKLQDLFCDSSKITALPQNKRIDCIFHELYDLPNDLVMPYCQLKTQEFILFLSRLPLQEISKLHPYDTEQVKVIKQIHAFLTANLQERYTIDYLSKQYLMNTSTLKTTFKAVYGAPIAAYMKEYRMNRAITYLRETDYSMAEISALVGYENQSKFTAAFKNVVGVLPTTFRKTFNGGTRHCMPR